MKASQAASYIEERLNSLLEISRVDRKNFGTFAKKAIANWLKIAERWAFTVKRASGSGRFTVLTSGKRG